MSRHWFERGTVPQQPTAPAAAYHIVASLLPRWFFRQRSPEHGYVFDVVGKDGRPTIWHVHTALTAQLEQSLKANRDIRSCKVSPFDKREAS